MGMEDEILEMDSLLSGTGAQTVTETPGTESPVTSTPATETPGTDAPTTDAPVEDSEPDKISVLHNEIKELKALLDKKPDEKKVEVPEVPEPLAVEDFVANIDLDDLTRDPDQLNKLLNNVFAKGVEYARKEVNKTRDDILSSLPATVKQNIEIISTLKKTSDEFYENNKDLKPFKKVVSTVFDELMIDDPGKDYRTLLKEVETEVRTRLELPRKPTITKDEKPPRLPSTKGGARAPQSNKPNNPLIDELSEMDKALNY